MPHQVMQKVPSFIYGTAWKKELTTSCVEDAVVVGFRALDTANQPKHYSEELVGEALQHLYRIGFSREEFFLQTKFTSVRGQDHRLPYDLHASHATQVEQSFVSSLQHLHTDYLDAYILHGPEYTQGLSAADWEVWGAFEKLYNSSRVKSIGVSNVSSEQLREFVDEAAIKPMMVQNRCFAVQGWDRAVRDICRQHNITYQGFSLLTANQQVWFDQRLKKIAEKYRVDPAQVIFRFATQIGILPLTGSSDPQHLKQDLRIFDFQLEQQEIETIERMAL